MKIRTLIKIFKKLLPIYEKAIESGNVPNALVLGICYAARMIFYKNEKKYCKIVDIFSENGYYGKFVSKRSYICNIIYHRNINKSIIIQCLIPRLEFLKKEILSLENLLNKGYTDV